MILLENSFLQQYFFAVAQTSPLPTQPRGLTTLTACEKPDGDAKQVQEANASYRTTHHAVTFQQWEWKGTSQPGRLRHFKPDPPHHAVTFQQ